MGSLNMVQIIGNLGQDVDLRHTDGGTAVATVGIATNRKYKDKNDELVEKVEWHRVTFWGKSAELADRYLSKGVPVYIQGRLETKKYSDKKTGEDKYSTEIICERMQFLSKGDGSGKQPHPADMAGAEGEEIDLGDSDIPF